MKNTNKYLILSAMVVSVFATSCNTQSAPVVSEKPSLCGMKCEFVPDSEVAEFYGKHLANADVYFPAAKTKAAKVDGCSDSVLRVIVPKGATSGKVLVVSGQDSVYSKFLFRDHRNTIIDFDKRGASWGGFDPFDEEGNPITMVSETADSVTKLPANLPLGCDGTYAFLFGKYKEPWSMSQNMYIQYVANPLDGGRGNRSVADVFEGYPLSQLALKFEVYVPEEVPYQKVHTEIYFGPYDAPDKHGRDRVPLYFWEPFAQTGTFSTSGWQTVTVPLTEFTHTTKSAEDKFPTPVDLQKSTNFSFVQFGDTTGGVADQYVFMCVDNFRIVPVGD